MRRFWIMLMVVAMAAIVALPATAKKPPKPPPSTTTTTIPAAVDCEFDENGTLQNWWSEDGPYRCRWTTSDRGEFTFHLTEEYEDDDGSVLRPHMFVTDSCPYGDKCFDALDNGWHVLPYAWESFNLPDDGGCDDSFPDPDPDGPDVFSLVIAARVKGTTPEVTVTQP